MTESVPSPKELAVFLTETVRKAARLALDLQQEPDQGDITTKDGRTADFQTPADKQVEKLIVDLLRDKFPNAEFLAEEGDYGVTEITFSNHGLVFVIDPIDGTTVYILGQLVYAISIGAFSYGEPIASAVYRRSNDSVYHTWKNAGTVFCNNKPLPRRLRNKAESIFMSEWAGGDDALELIEGAWEALCGEVGARMPGCFVESAIWVIEGSAGFFHHNSGKPHDWGAVLLFFIEMGIEVYNWDETGPEFYSPTNIFNESIFAVWPRLRHRIQAIIWQI